MAVAPDLSSSRIYQNGTLSGAATGMPLVWIDDTRLMTESCTNIQSNWQCMPVGLFDKTGTQVGTANVPLDVVPVSGDTVYSPSANAQYNITTGATTWKGQTVTAGELAAMAGGYAVVVASGGGTVFVEKP
jgi:hypothetical protein